MPPFEASSIRFTRHRYLRIKQPHQFARVVLTQCGAGTVDVGDIQPIFGLSRVPFSGMLKFCCPRRRNDLISKVRFATSNVQRTQCHDRDQ